MNELVTLEALGPTSLITLNNPKTRNALSADMITALTEALLEAGADTDCKAIVLTGAGGHFCSGGDVSAMTADRPMLGSRLRIERAHRIIRLINGGPKPVIAAVDGVAFGLGLSLTTACDFTVASKSSSFCAVFNKVGLLPDMGLLATLPQRVSLGTAKRLMFTAARLSGLEAHQIGLVDLLVDEDSALETALQQAGEFATVAPIPVALTKAFYSKSTGSLEEALRAEVDHQPALYLSEDHLEGVTAFREKRSPKFRGR
jgi:enoyl-CoA hydratase/carnithine racemase